ncbi:MAG TPA: dihydrofolate reductase family protein [Candidatus Eremiobacteraceae bacterium]|jgi:dihydrofolate reductase|nr:dihydrofolate reductase family protein [Candidatus Eremiobacteraceae bacterium]
MTRFRVSAFGISVDGFGAGAEQSLDNPMGVGGLAMHGWAFETKTFRAMHGAEGGSTGVDEEFAARSFENVGAWILGRNMFGPVRGSWGDESWKGWWGDTPPYHVPVFVLTHYERPPLEMMGGTTFYFVTEGIEEAAKKAAAAAGGKDVRIGGGVSTIQQYLRAGVIDEMHLVVSPVLLGVGEKFFGNLDLVKMGFRVTQHVMSERVMHVVMEKKR